MYKDKHLGGDIVLNSFSKIIVVGSPSGPAQSWVVGPVNGVRYELHLVERPEIQK